MKSIIISLIIIVSNYLKIINALGKMANINSRRVNHISHKHYARNNNNKFSNEFKSIQNENELDIFFEILPGIIIMGIIILCACIIHKKELKQELKIK